MSRPIDWRILSRAGRVWSTRSNAEYSARDSCCPMIHAKSPRLRVAAVPMSDLSGSQIVRQGKSCFPNRSGPELAVDNFLTDFGDIADEGDWAVGDRLGGPMVASLPAFRTGDTTDSFHNWGRGEGGGGGGEARRKRVVCLRQDPLRLF